MTIRVTYPDGRVLTDVPSSLSDMAGLISADISGYDPDNIHRFIDAPLTFGDDILDGWQGAAWLLRNRFLGDCDPITSVRSSCPVVAVGSGPGLDESIDIIARNQHGYTIVAAASAVPRLLAAGIVPDLVCPSERTDATHLIQFATLPGMTYAGLPCVPHEPQRYQRHFLVAGNDVLWKWAGYGHASMALGSTTGVNAAMIGSVISDTVYLVGHDLVSGHYAGFSGEEDSRLGVLSLLCNDGKERPSSPLWERCRRELGSIAGRARVYSCDPTGASIFGTPFKALPESSTYTQKLIAPKEASDIKRQDALRMLAIGLPMALQRSKEAMQAATDLDGTRVSQITTGDYYGLIAYVFRSLWFQMSLEVKLGLPKPDVTAWCKEAYGNAIDGIMGSAEEIAHDAL